ncbi:hypothetical protein PISMIDRAFT_110045 [Pisolithus microcarpus 441]|uniref:Uncharacterized protein n=1 Tax=Pisolithus microcarpus 441 TaxID=765257 RepID=A0A0C9ZDU8_9AGAM|nr:hypothetical protein PISMIDRAFT_110045 [Pisolithus microcarpus 441]
MHYIKSCPIPTFYDTNEPPQLPMLSSQLEMYYQLKTCVHVSAMEEMSLSHPLTAVPATNMKLTTKTLCMGTPGTSSRATTPRVVTPVPKSLGKVAEKSVTIIEDQSLDSPSSSESSLLSWDEDESDRKKIPKPNGKVGQPGHSGYNLEDQLGWGKDGFKKLKWFVKKAVRRHLDPTKCRSLQDHKVLETVSKVLNFLTLMTSKTAGQFKTLYNSN